MRGSRFPVLCLTVIVLLPITVLAEEVIPLAAPATGASLLVEGDGAEILTVTVSELRLDAVEIENRQWAVVRVPSGHGLMERGEPSLPFLATEYLLEASGGIALELIGTTTRDIDLAGRGFAGVAPSRGHFNRNIDPDTVPYVFSEKIYGAAVSYPAATVWMDDPFIAGPLRGQSARIPVAVWHSGDNLLTVVEEARYRVVHTADAPNPRTRPEPPMTGLFDQLARHRMVNYDLARGRYVPFVEAGRLLILSYDDFVDEIQPLADWQRQVGYPTQVVPLSTVGATASQVLSYIQSLYNQPDSLTWIILVGDAAQMPYLLGVNEGAVCDPCYTKLEGSDNRPDAAISRISARSGAEVTAQVDKILTYERYPDQGSAAAWYPEAFGVAGDSYGGGAYDYERMEWLRQDLLEPAYTYTEFTQLYHESVTPAQVAAAVNDGRSLGLYIGHGWPQGWGTSGFDVNHVNSLLSNGEMLPVIWSVACNNGEFTYDNPDCFAEAWLKKAGGGAVSFEGGTTSESWVPPCDAQRGVIDSLRLETAFTTGGEHVNGKLYCMDVNGDANYDEGTKFMEQSTLFGTCTTWIRTLPPQLPDEPVDFSAGGGVATMTVTVGGLPLAKANAAIVSFFTEDGGFTLVGSGLVDDSGVVHATISGEPTHCHIHGQNLVPQSFELAARPDGRVSLDAEAYGCGGTVTVRVSDSNVPGSSPSTIDTVQVTLAVPGDTATVTLTEAAADRSLYSGTAVLGADLTGGHGDPLTATYLDADDGAGGVNVVKTDTAVLDCAGPLISGVELEATNNAVTARFTTDEPGTTVVRYGTTRPPLMVAADTALTTAHEITIEGVDPCTLHWIGVESADALGNLSVDTNGGAYYPIETMGWQVFLSEPFDADPGWTIDNGGNSHGWAFGQPTGGGGQYGEPDPTSGHTGSSVYGVNLLGDYDNSLTTDQLKLTTPSLDLSEATSVSLRYWRWLGVESPSYDHARVQVSVDGGAFATVWENTETMDGGSWEEVALDLTARAAGHSDVRIRWTMGPTDSSWQFAGWNLDDVVIEGAFPCDGSSLPFLDGFESGDCSAWSAMLP
jgi:hypothetical protein